MAEALVDGTGSGYFARVSPEGRLLVDLSGTSLFIGSVSAHVDSIYVQSGIISVDNMYAGSETWVKNLYDGSSVWQGERFGISGIVDVGNFDDLGSNTVVTNFGDLGSSRVVEEVIPTDSSKNNPLLKFEYITSGTSTGVTGSSVGSIISFIGAGSFVKTINYSNDLITSLGSYV